MGLCAEGMPASDLRTDFWRPTWAREALLLAGMWLEEEEVEELVDSWRWKLLAAGEATKLK